MSIPVVGVEFFHEDRRIGMTNLEDLLRNFANAPKTQTVNAV